MEKLYSKTIGTPVVEDHMRPITTVRDLVFDPENGKLLAFVVNENKGLVIVPVDVLAWYDVLRVHDREAIIDAEEVLRVEKFLKGEVRILQNRVETKAGKYLGRVYDMAINNKSFMLEKLFIAKGFLGLVRYETRIIPYKSILEITAEKILVKDDMGKIEVEEKVPAKMEEAIG